MKKFGVPAWSVALDKARKRVTMLKKCLSMACTGLDIASQLTQPTQEDPWDEVPFIIPTTIQECTTQLKSAKRHVKEIVNSSFSTRDAVRRRQIQELGFSTSKSDKETVQILRRLQKAEDTKQLFRKLKAR